MRVAITAKGYDLGAEVDERFGRAKCFLVVDTESGAFEVIENEQNLNAPQGAGIQAAAHVSECGVEAVITGNVGPKAFVALSAADITVHPHGKGTVSEALDAFKAGDLPAVEEANVEGHWTGA